MKSKKEPTIQEFHSLTEALIIDSEPLHESMKKMINYFFGLIVVYSILIRSMHENIKIIQSMD